MTAILDVCNRAVDRHLAFDELSSTAISHLLAYAMACRIGGRLGDSERVVALCGKGLDAMPVEARDEPDSFAALSEYWTQVAKNLWQHEPVDEHALGDALQRAIEAAEEASRRAPNSGAYQAMVAERRVRLERSGLAPGAIAQLPVCKD
jgi:hypothetical protein